MRRARVNFEIVPDEEVIPVEGATIPFDDPIGNAINDIHQTMENLISEIVGAPIEPIPARWVQPDEMNFAMRGEQTGLESASANFRSQFLTLLYTAQTQEEVEAILNTTEAAVAREDFYSYFSSSVMGFEGAIAIEPVNVVNGEVQTPSLSSETFEVEFTEPYFNPTAFEVGAVRSSDLALPEELVDNETEGSVTYDDNGNPIELPEDIFEPVAPVTRRGRRNHTTEEVPQQSINQELTPEELQMLEEAVIDSHREIPPNSGTLLVEETTSRFSSAIWFEAIKTKIVMLAGLGGIGSFIGFLLSRMQPAYIILYDDDVVETGNLSGQLYSIQNIGNTKTSSLTQMMRDYGSYHSTTTFNKYDRNSNTTDIMICGFDNMEARKIYFTNWLARVDSKTTIEEKKKCLFIDGRIKC